MSRPKFISLRTGHIEECPDFRRDSIYRNPIHLLESAADYSYALLHFAGAMAIKTIGEVVEIAKNLKD